MKRKFLVFGLLVSSLLSYGQKTPDSVYKKERVSETDIQVLFSYYTQNGDHSAVTGGIGTEQLKVYAPEVIITRQPDTLNTYKIDVGVDVITSASTDKIDYVVSSASRVDSRVYTNLSYTRRLKNTNTHIGVNTGGSIESAYLSLPVGLSVDHINKNGSREVSASLQCFFDDLRWGRLDPDYYHAVEVVYPVELRYKKWFTEYRRNSYNLSLAFYQTINKKMQFALFPELVYQHGLLATPYHRVYFNDHKTERVENLPDERWKIPLGAQLNIFAGGRVVIRSYYRFYFDDFGILAHTFQVETPIKLSPQFSVAPLFRFYTQSASYYFKPYMQHNPGTNYYTSDYDLSQFNSYELGINLRYNPHSPLFRKFFFKSASLRYAFYKRTDDLAAHVFSLLIDINHTNLKNR